MGTIRKLLGGIKRRIYQDRKISVWCLEGGSKKNRDPLKIIFIGDVNNREYFTRLVFENSVKATLDGTITAKKVHMTWQDLGRDTDLVVIKTNREEEALSKQMFFAVPCWMDVIQLTNMGPNRKPVSKSLRDDLRKVRKYKYTYDVVTDRASFDDFYHNMYLPYTQGRHEQAAMPITYEQMVQKLPHSELLQVKRDGSTVAASMILYGEKEVHGWKIGIRGGYELLAKQGVTAATHLFVFQYIARKGWKEINIGGTRAFLKDGQFQYKKKWGVKLGRVWEQRFYIKAMRPSIGAQAFFTQNPFLHTVASRKVGSAFVSDAERVTQHELNQLVKQLFVEGMDTLIIYSLKGDWRKAGLRPPQPEVRLSGADQLWQR